VPRLRDVERGDDATSAAIAVAIRPTTAGSTSVLSLIVIEYDPLVAARRFLGSESVMLDILPGPRAVRLFALESWLTMALISAARNKQVIDPQWSHLEQGAGERTRPRRWSSCICAHSPRPGG
jgi:hypothetical protein